MGHAAALLITLVLPWNVAPTPPIQEEDMSLVFVGTYTSAEGEGINLLRMDPESGRIESLGVVARTENPSFLAIHPDGQFLYAVNEVGDYEGESSGSVSAFRIDPKTGSLSPLNRRSSRGAAPCHIIVDDQGRNVLVANYSGGSVTVLPIEADGSLADSSDVEQHEGSGPNPRRQEGPHAHSINLDANGRFAVAADLGLDQLLVYRFDPDSGTLSPNEPPSASVAPGAGPRHFEFHPNGRLAFAINEIASTVTAFRYDPETGILTEAQTRSTLPEGFEGNNSTADIHVHPAGRFLYGSNRGHDSLAIFRIDEQTGMIEPIGHASTGGETPRNFGIDPTGRFLLAANQGTDTVVVFRIDPDTGMLEPTGNQAEVPMPVCVKFYSPGS
ncbi:lactonase family protein [Tautonia plasticadhaerens]|uniref:6-phosphogluconolactonase n=1 Tax=Tautonia plasticadhaerens TaxID=2527974 RepID=A0A518H8L5_9BACT|nr:lactonase family protein [Tautonia plasticadhaerens]QDV37198.1 6-phosphogluconolactonase [Tautonia plasticadhaerens]